MQNLRMTTLAAASLACASFASFGGTLVEDFANPPQKAGVHAWWLWVGYNVSKAGITRDLEAMKSAGLGGATIFTIASHSGRWNAEAVKIHLDNVLKPLVVHLGPLVGKSFKHILMDSYEAGDCNWAQTFREEFLTRREALARGAASRRFLTSCSETGRGRRRTASASACGTTSE